MQRVVAIAVFHVAAHGMPHVGRMYPYLILPACFKFVFHKRVVGCAVEHVEMGHRILTPVVGG